MCVPRHGGQFREGDVGTRSVPEIRHRGSTCPQPAILRLNRQFPAKTENRPDRREVLLYYCNTGPWLYCTVKNSGI